MNRETLSTLFSKGSKTRSIVEQYIGEDEIYNFEFAHMERPVLAYNSANYIIRKRIQPHGWTIKKYCPYADGYTYAYSLEPWDNSMEEEKPRCPCCNHVLTKVKFSLIKWDNKPQERESNGI